jgi:hypothetical protein
MSAGEEFDYGQPFEVDIGRAAVIAEALREYRVSASHRRCGDARRGDRLALQGRRSLTALSPMWSPICCNHHRTGGRGLRSLPLVSPDL